MSGLRVDTYLDRIGRAIQESLRATILIVALAAATYPLDGQTPPQWRLAEPNFEVGGFAADSAAEFANLGGVTVLENGNVVVADRVAPFLRVFDRAADTSETLAGLARGRGSTDTSMRWTGVPPESCPSSMLTGESIGTRGT